MMTDARSYVFVSHASADNVRLRPVLLGLLDAGVPIWLDKPDAPGTGLPRGLFAGFIPDNAHWADVVEQAIAGSCAMLIFPSAAAARSVQVKREAEWGRALRARDPDLYSVTPAFLERRDVPFEGRVSKGLQGFDTSVEQASPGDFRVTSEGAIQLDHLIDFLKRRVAEADRRQPGRVRNRVVPPDYHVPFLVDRTMQRDHVVAALGRHRAPVLVVRARVEDEPGRFLNVTLARQVLPSLARANCTAESQQALRVRWPSVPSSNQDAFFHCLAANIAERFQLKSREPSCAPPATTEELCGRLATAFAQNGASRIVAARVPVRPGDARASEEAVQAWSAFWGAFPLETANAAGLTLLPVLELCSDPAAPTVGFDWFGRLWPLLNRRTRAAASSPATLSELPELGHVTARCARDWIETDILFMDHADNARERLADDLAALIETSFPKGGICMKQWATKAAPLLIEAGVT